MKSIRKTTLPSFAVTFVLCYLFWILITGSFAAEELIAGAVVSAIVAWFSARFLVHEKALWLISGRLGSLIVYCIAVFPWELIKANVDVAFRALNPKLPINPGIVRVRSQLKSEYGMAMLADSITLTPGTITMDIDIVDGEACYYIHWLNVTETDREKAGELIKGRLEKWVGRIWK